MNDLKFSPQQDSAMRDMKSWWLNDSRRPFIINGYAGTGKTTIAKHIGDNLDFDQSKVIYTAYTGKAASQLRKKGCTDATTIHKLLYKPIEKGSAKLEELMTDLGYAENIKDRELISELKRQIKAEKKFLKEVGFESAPDEVRIDKSNIIVVDEHSMLTEKIYNDLLSTGLPVIFCGDPFQLPPVKGFSPISNMKPDVTLTEVHRQALDNPILRLATKLRDGDWFKFDAMKEKNGDQELSIVPRSMAGYELYDSHDQILCAMNSTRTGINMRMQKRKIVDGVIKPISLIPDNAICEGDRIIFLANHYEEEIFNGTIGKISDVLRADTQDPKLDYPHHYWKINGNTEDTKFEDYLVYNRYISDPKNAERKRVQMIDLAYAITAHKSQGSEWDSVLVHFESLRDSNMARWMYTSITRASRRCTITVPEVSQ